MEQYLIAFITGLTTGGLSCLAVQGGLLASSLGRQIEQDYLRQVRQSPGKSPRPSHRSAQPILLFLSAKLAVYTLLGLALGAFGSMLTLTPALRAALLIAIGVFMLGNALRMLNVHPIFRYFAIEPPRFITRAIRKKAKNGDDWFTPLALGGLTVFIPCGVTQAMMAVAIGSGSAIQGALLMAAFTLGTSPVFFLVAYLAASLGARLESIFMRFVALVILVLGLFSIASGLNLAGAPVPVTTWMQRLATGPQPVEQVDRASANGSLSGSILTLEARNNGYFPTTLYASANTPLQLDIVTQNTVSCAIAFVIPNLGFETILPRNGVTSVEIPPQAAGAVLPFTCSMGMYTGQIVFE